MRLIDTQGHLLDPSKQHPLLMQLPSLGSAA